MKITLLKTTDLDGYVQYSILRNDIHISGTVTHDFKKAEKMYELALKGAEKIVEIVKEKTI